MKNVENNTNTNTNTTKKEINTKTFKYISISIISALYIICFLTGLSMYITHLEGTYIEMRYIDYDKLNVYGNAEKYCNLVPLNGTIFMGINPNKDYHSPPSNDKNGCSNIKASYKSFDKCMKYVYITLAEQETILYTECFDISNVNPNNLSSIHRYNGFDWNVDGSEFENLRFGFAIYSILGGVCFIFSMPLFLLTLGWSYDKYKKMYENENEKQKRLYRPLF